MKRIFLSTASALMIVGTGSASAAAISWSAADFTDAAQVSNTGTLVEARNLGHGATAGGVNTGTATANVTINGVTFASTPGDGTDTFGVSSTDFHFTATHDPGTDPITGVSAADANALIDSIIFVPGATVPPTLARVDGLTIGTVYEIQVIVASRQPNPANGFDFGHAVTSGGPAVFTLLDVDAATTVNIVTGTFTATETVQDIHIETLDTNLEASAFQLRVVPEPSSMALLGLGGLLVARSRRG